jgi:cytochrome c553
MKTKLGALCVAALAAYSCGKSESESVTLNTPAEADAGILSKGLFRVVEHTVNKPAEPIDYLMIVESNGEWRYRVQGRFEDGMNTLSARLGFMSQVDWNMAVAPGEVRVQQGNNAIQPASWESNGLYITSGSTSGVVGKATPDYAGLMRDRAIKSRAQNGNGANVQYRPLSSLKKILDSAAANSFPRAGARLSVFFVGTSDEGSEKLETSEIVNLLNSKVGENTWALSVLTTPPEGCVYNDNGDKIGYTNPGETNDNKYLLHKLGSLEKNKLISICEDNYNVFLEQFLTNKGLASSFDIALPDKALWDSIQVTVDGSILLGWKYVPGETKISIPAHLKNGSKVKVSFEVDWGKKENVEDPLKYGAPTLVRKKLSPEEKEFQDEIDPIISGSCGNCHGAGGAQKQYAGSFKNVSESKASILDRIKRAQGTAGFMPQGGNPVSPADIQKLEAYYTKYGF